jgi:thiazole synthase
VAKDPPSMGIAFRKSVEAGRIAHLSGLGNTNEYARATSPLTQFLG